MKFKSSPQAQQTARIELGRELLRRFGEIRFTAVGTSMLPTLYPRDVLTVHRRDATEILRGDIVVYARDDRLYAHRVVRKTESGDRFAITTRGDALLKDDPSVDESELLGRVATIARGSKHIVPLREFSWPLRMAAWTVQRSDALARFLLSLHIFLEQFLRQGKVSQHGEYCRQEAS